MPRSSVSLAGDARIESIASRGGYDDEPHMSVLSRMQHAKSCVILNEIHRLIVCREMLTLFMS